MRIRQSVRDHQLPLITQSPLRRVDPRTKLFISLAISSVVMMPLERLGIFMCLYTAFLLWARLLPASVKQVWRVKWILVALFALDWWLIGIDHAILIIIRLVLLTGTFTLFFSTTTTRELSLALERLRIPYRYAFSLSQVFQSIGLLDDEWQAIQEAQRSRGAIQNTSTFRRFITQLRDLVSLAVPAIVLTTKRAWMITESAYTRGFDSPNRKSYHVIKPGWLDGVLFLGTVVLLSLLFMEW